MAYKIYISTFGQKCLKVKGGIPIEVGAACRSELRYPLHDDTGDNISIENAYYGELTGMYWVWKNTQVADDDIIGFCHYNKTLLISKRKVKTWLKHHVGG